MTKPFQRRAFLAACGASALAQIAFAEAPTVSLRPKQRSADLLRKAQADPSDLIDQAALNGATGYAVMDLQQGTLLEAGNEAVPLPPASVAKILTAAYALDALGPDHHFMTRIVATGPVRNGRLEGDLVLVGGGDPTLDTDALVKLAKQLQQAGITSVSGQFSVWGGALPQILTIDTGQPPHVGYSPAISGLNLNFNRVHFGWTRRGSTYDITMDARSESLRPAVDMARMRVEPRSTPIYTYADREGRDIWTVARNALGDGGARWLPVRKPALYAGEVFQAVAAAEGIRLTSPRVLEQAPDGDTIATLDSAPLRVILRDMLKWSTNLTAEIVGLSATKSVTGHAPTSLTESARAMSDWANRRFSTQSLALVDHSGLSEENRVTAGDMASALVQLRRSRGLKPLLKAFAMRDGQRRIIKDHPLSVHAKTGTLNFVSGLAGFVDLPDGRELVFAIFSADLARREALTPAERERPKGGADWNRRAKTLQQALIERWGNVYAK